MGNKRTQRRTLLIVEDEQSTREGMAELLERGGYRVITAADEREAVESVRLVRPDLILVELGGTSLDLLSVGERVRGEAESNMEIPIVAYAGRPDELVGEGCDVLVGNNRYVTLPEDFQQLENLIERLLSAT
jgi:CheY-like chemotaxis protein